MPAAIVYDHPQGSQLCAVAAKSSTHEHHEGSSRFIAYGIEREVSVVDDGCVNNPMNSFQWMM